jgi:nitronate monooxygenase
MLPQQLLASLRLPLMAAPMSIASTVQLVEAACRAGVIGCFPTHNAARGGGLRAWLDHLVRTLAAERDATPFA